MREFLYGKYRESIEADTITIPREQYNEMLRICKCHGISLLSMSLSEELRYASIHGNDAEVLQYWRGQLGLFKTNQEVTLYGKNGAIAKYKLTVDLVEIPLENK